MEPAWLGLHHNVGGSHRNRYTILHGKDFRNPGRDAQKPPVSAFQVIAMDFSRPSENGSRRVFDVRSRW